MTEPLQTARELFRHVSADKTQLYRTIMEAFAAAKRQFRLHLRPDEVQLEAQWQGEPPLRARRRIGRIDVDAAIRN